jgi:phosphoglycolate phosphatase
VLKHVIFDLDGTLVDSVPGIQWSVEAAMEFCHLSRVCPDLTPLIGPPIRTILTTACGTTDSAELDKIERAFRKFYDTEGLRRTICQPAVEQMLHQLRTHGCTLSIVTNKPAHATGLILGSLGINGYFQAVVCRDPALPSLASKPEMLIGLLNRQVIPREESIMVGDTLEDCHAAVVAGIACAVVSHGYGRDMSGKLPSGCRRITCWEDLVEWCAGRTPARYYPQKFALMSEEGTTVIQHD